MALFANIHKIKYEDGRDVTFNTLLGRQAKSKRVQSIKEMRSVIATLKNPKSANEDVPEWALKGTKKHHA